MNTTEQSVIKIFELVERLETEQYQPTLDFISTLDFIVQMRVLTYAIQNKHFQAIERLVVPLAKAELKSDHVLQGTFFDELSHDNVSLSLVQRITEQLQQECPNIFKNFDVFSRFFTLDECSDEKYSFFLKATARPLFLKSKTIYKLIEQDKHLSTQYYLNHLSDTNIDWTQLATTLYNNRYYNKSAETVFLYGKNNDTFMSLLTQWQHDQMLSERMSELVANCNLQKNCRMLCPKLQKIIQPLKSKNANCDPI